MALSVAPSPARSDCTRAVSASRSDSPAAPASWPAATSARARASGAVSARAAAAATIGRRRSIGFLILRTGRAWRAQDGCIAAGRRHGNPPQRPSRHLMLAAV